MIGKVLAKRYEVLARVGEGGMAVVYRARDTLLGRMVALKVLRPQYASDAEFVERFRREAQTAASLSHPNVVNIHDVGEEGSIYYIVMEYVEGRNLKEIIRQEGPLPIRTSIFIAREIARALEAAHRLNLTHRDVKPHNILITFDGRVKVTDFGIARAAATSSLTQTGTVIGSVHYFSPEQARGEPVGTASDIYSLGVLLYEMVTGQVPFTGDSPVSIALKHVQEQPKPPRQLNPAVPPELERIILRAMAKSASQRYPSATAMLRDLRSLGEEFDGAASDEEITQPLTPLDPKEATIVVAPEAVDMARQSKRTSRRSQKRSSNAWLWPLVLLSFLGGLLWAGTALPGMLFPEEVRVPSVVGKDLATAERILKEAGLKLTEERRIYHNTVPAGIIISQDPPENRRVRMGRNVFVTVSNGVRYISVPDVIGLSLDEAEKRLTAGGLVLGTVTEERRVGVAGGIVLRQDPAGGSKLEEGARVHLVVTERSQEAERVEVPDLAGLSVEAARESLIQRNLKVGKEIAEPAPGVTPGTVIDQSMPPGTEVEPGTVIDFVYVASDSDGGEARPRLLTASPREQLITYTVHITVPPGPEVDVRVVTIDDFGEREWHNERRQGGDEFDVDVSVRGRTTRPVVKVYFDDELVSEQVIR